MASATIVSETVTDGTYSSKPLAVKKRLKVLEVLEATALGTACYMANLLMNIDTTKFDVALAYSRIRSDERFRKELKHIERRGIRVYEIPMQRNIQPRKDVASLWALYRLIRAGKFNIVHGHSSKAGFLARLAAKLASPRTITIYSPHAISISLNPKYWYVEKLAGLLTNVVLGVSRTEHDELLSYRIVPEPKVRYVTTGIRVASYCGSFGGEKLRRQLGLADGTMLIGTAGRFTEQKDPSTFLKAAAETLARGVQAHFAWVGYGELEEPSERLARELGIRDRVSFLGYCEDLRPFLDAVDIFALTSRFESFGYVTCEAMAMSKPVVATNVSGSKELVIPGVTGYLVKVADATAFAAVYSELAADPDLRRVMGEAGRARVQKHYDLPQTITGLEQLYRELSLRSDAAFANKAPTSAATLEVNN